MSLRVLLKISLRECFFLTLLRLYSYDIREIRYLGETFPPLYPRY